MTIRRPWLGGHQGPEGRRAAEDEAAQAALELALVVPLVACLLLAVVQVALVVRDQVLVVHAAREAARAGAVDRSPGAPRRAAEAAAPLDGTRLEVSAARGGGGRMDVTVAYRCPTVVPLVGPLFPDLALRARASMRVET